MAARTALITGITGQDGAYLARHLLDRGVTVWGAVRQSARDGAARLRALGIADDVRDVLVEMTEPGNLLRALSRIQPDEVYHLAAPSFVGASFEQPAYVLDVIATGTARLLDAVRTVAPGTRVYHASTSEMFGAAGEDGLLSEDSPFRPRSPYAVAKCAAHQLVALSRDTDGLWACSGILFNHESPLRGTQFVTRHISRRVAAIVRGEAADLRLGNLDARRDWGWAPEYVDAMHRMLQQDAPRDLVIATGQDASVREFTTAAFEAAGIGIDWRGEGASEVGSDRESGVVRVRIDAARYRPAEVHRLRGDASRARAALGWTPSKAWRDVAHAMVAADLSQAVG